ncbi:hypothetical protein KTC96_18920 [Clostridium estertheticum]|uniref:hypothetical protein n=1 Tax=Clostridium estertheticum TaxID=238834 RepID=UPI001C7D08FB|nr:hypothetical protein [Clostridium estertheticum]MBX4258550.1 hypothetical protein [Clostridium estertheticum]WLC69972.1 hypothetical protein KTC96_18920 [Clostridium estertheticum]
MDDMKPTKEDVVYTIAKAGISSIPIVGGAASEIFSAILTPPLTKRREKWLNEIAERLQALEENIPEFKIESLSENDMFITCILQATQSAIRNHQQEKLIALRNTVLNAAITSSIDDNIQLMFIQFIDALTPWHLKVLDLFNNPLEWFNRNNVPTPNILMGAPAQILELAFNDLKGRRPFYDQIVKDLYSRGLMNTDSLHITMSGSGIIASRTSEMGKMFIRYITSPV